MGPSWEKIPADLLDRVTLVAMIFLLVTHLVHWYSDFVAYTKWFKVNDVIKASIGGMGSAANMESPINSLIFRLKSLEESNSNANERVVDIEKIDEALIKSVSGDRNVAADLNNLREGVRLNSSSLESIQSQTTEILSLLQGIGPNFSSIKWTSCFVIIGWYLVVPITTVVAALWSIYS